MVPPCVDKFIASEVALFVTVPYSPDDITRIKAAAEATRETTNTLRFISADDEGRSFSGRSIDELAVWLAYRYGVYVDSDHRRHNDGVDSPVCTGAFVVVNDTDALENNWGLIVGLSLRWYEHSVDEDEPDGETEPKFTNEQIKAAALSRTTLPGLIIGNFKAHVSHLVQIPALIHDGWKPLSAYQEMAEDDPDGILAPYEQDNTVPTSQPSEPPTQAVYLYRTSHGTIIQTFSEVEIGTPAWGDGHGDGQIVERVNADGSPYGVATTSNNQT